VAIVDGPVLGLDAVQEAVGELEGGLHPQKAGAVAHAAHMHLVLQGDAALYLALQGDVQWLLGNAVTSLPRSSVHTTCMKDAEEKPHCHVRSQQQLQSRFRFDVQL